MDIASVLLKRHSKSTADKIVMYVGNNPTRFSELVEVFLQGPHRITQRAAGPLTDVVERNPSIITPHLSKILRQCEKPDVHDAVRRNVMRLLQFIEVPARHRGKAVDVCFRFLQDKSQAVAIRCFAMTVLSNISEHEPGLSSELRHIIEDQVPYGSPAFVSRAKKVLQRLHRPVAANSYLASSIYHHS